MATYSLVKDRMKLSALRLKVHDDSLGMPYGAVRDLPPPPPMAPPPAAPAKQAAKAPKAPKASSEKPAKKK